MIQSNFTILKQTHVRSCVSIVPITHNQKEAKPITNKVTYRILSTVHIP